MGMNAGRIPVRVARDEAEAGRMVADIMTETARAAVAERGRFTLAISGGSSPKCVYKQLAQRDRLESFPWNKTVLLWVDERAVPLGHRDSNAGRFMREDLPNLPIKPDQIHRMRGELGPHEGALDYRQVLASVLRTQAGEDDVLDFALLGMGPDGHTASLFPAKPSLDSQETVIGITDSPKPPPERITLTMPVLRGARRLVVLVLGEGKAEAVARSLSGERLPARLVSEGANAIWVIDKAAASALPQTPSPR